MIEKNNKKYEREQKILIGLVELYLETGRPIGSNTLKEREFEDLSSATIRNYFSKLEDLGFLTQQHSSGGRIPTEQAFKYYACSENSKDFLTKKQRKDLEKSFDFEGKQVVKYLNMISETIAEKTNSAVFISSPRFDQDFITDMKIILLNQSQLLAILITSFGMIHTETFPIESKISNFSIKRIESYLHFRMTGLDKPHLSNDEKKLAHKIYQEVMLRHIVAQSNIFNDDLSKTGFSHLLSYPELCHAQALSNCLSLFESPPLIDTLINTTLKDPGLKFWIGEDLNTFISPPYVCSVITIPYTINKKPVGVIGLMGPIRMHYKYIFEVLKTASDKLSETLTKLLFKHHISYRLPKSKSLDFKTDHPAYLNETNKFLLDDHSTRYKEDEENSQ